MVKVKIIIIRRDSARLGNDNNDYNPNSKVQRERNSESQIGSPKFVRQVELLEVN